EDSPAGEAARKSLGDESRELEVRQQCSAGLNFGYFYADSPIIAYDGEAQPTYSMHEFQSSTVPGCRAPHVWLEGGRSLYDELGPYYSIVRIDPSIAVDPLIQAARARGIPLKLV